jgi:hypothetical protein
VNLKQTASRGSLVFQVEADDSDQEFSELSYMLLGDATTLRYFTINATGGSITVQGDLANAPGQQTQYVVRTVKC